MHHPSASSSQMVAFFLVLGAWAALGCGSSLECDSAGLVEVKGVCVPEAQDDKADAAAKTDVCGGCSGKKPVCEVDSGTCAQCLPGIDESQCTGDTLLCDTSTGACVQCIAGRDESACVGDTPLCRADTNQCVQCLPGEDESQCAGDTPVCEADGNQCVRCNENADCTSDQPVCEDHECTDCTTEACALYSDTPACDSNTGGCVECVPGEDEGACVGATPVCDDGGNTCVECNGDAQCTTDALPRCTGHTCVECLGDGDCGGSTPYCSANQCVACLSDDDCGGLLYCDEDNACAPGNWCEPCDANAACRGDSVCIAVSGGELAGECYPRRAGLLGGCQRYGLVQRAIDDDVVGTSSYYCRPREGTCSQILRYGMRCDVLVDDVCHGTGIGRTASIACRGFVDCLNGASCAPVADDMGVCAVGAEE